MLLFAWTEPDFQEVLGSSGGGLLTGALEGQPSVGCAPFWSTCNKHHSSRPLVEMQIFIGLPVRSFNMTVPG